LSNNLTISLLRGNYGIQVFKTGEILPKTRIESVIFFGNRFQQKFLSEFFGYHKNFKFGLPVEQCGFPVVRHFGTRQGQVQVRLLFAKY